MELFFIFFGIVSCLTPAGLDNDKYNIIIIIQDDAIISSNIIMYSISLIITTIKDDIKIKLIIYKRTLSK